MLGQQPEKKQKFSKTLLTRAIGYGIINDVALNSETM